MKILHGHALEQLRTLPDNAVHCVVTSPPYYGLRDYKTPEVTFPAGTFTPVAGLPSMALPAWTGHLGLEPDPWQFVGHMVQIFREVRRVLREDGSLWMNFGDSYASTPGGYGYSNGSDVIGRKTQSAVLRGGKGSRGASPKHADSAGMPLVQPNRMPIVGLKPKDLILMPARIALALQADGWYLRSDIIWHKPNPMPESVTDRPTKAHEYIFLMSKSERYFYDAEAIKEATTGNAHARWDGVNPKAKTPGANSRIHKTHVGASPQPSQNESFSAAVCGLADSRNKRTVWTIATSPYPDAHFATYPPDLIRPCILAGTSARGCCPDCGAPWERVTEKTTTHQSNAGKRGTLIQGKGHPSTQVRDNHDIRNGPVNSTVTTGWKPTCQCYTDQALTDVPPDEWPTVPAVLLDPFGGSGTTAEVAIEYARDAILIELGEHHLPLIEKRCHATQPGLPLH